jgi:DNA/RNA-binding domain of Phe-tRNA-synthetase-like protein
MSGRVTTRRGHASTVCRTTGLVRDRKEENMLSISETAAWKAAHPGAAIGLLELSRVTNTGPSPQLEDRKREAEARLRAAYRGFARQDFLALPVIAAYERYYRRFKKTYHVQLQLESIVLKGKNLPAISPLVDSNFIAEVQTLVLTAGHDAARLQGSVHIDVSNEGDPITQMNGSTKPMHAGDMIMRDADGVCCSIIYGQDNRSPISSETDRVLYVAYAPGGVPAESVADQLRKIEENVRLFCPRAVTEQLRVLSA